MNWIDREGTGPPPAYSRRKAPRESVPLEGKPFAAATGSSVSLLFGGTLVFDERGNLQMCCRKHGGDVDPERQQRRLELLAQRSG